MIDLSHITSNGRALFLAYDQGLEHGPTDFNDETIDPEFILKIGLDGKFNAIIFQKGIAEKYYSSELKNELSLIVKLNGKTNLVKDQDPYSPLLCSVDEAIKLGAVGVGYTVYPGSEFEAKMTEELATVVREAHAQGIPVVGWMYPRGKNVPNPTDPEIIAYAARLGLELGADIVKVQYPGSLESLKHVIQSAGKTKVVVSGGKKESEEEFLETARIVVKSGALGMAVGRNIWQSKEPLEVTRKLKEIIFDQTC
ncbi:MAG: hypothetical protein A3F31_01740 [Candidatus Levybacteria bacterium RIFCSPHIGHO2_12_FULL_38_12]|nr:MAG: hypothetical protein A2770_03200 [Candidatus Levybacteria bacterium RIFCSPHIGHO2_01_FULL_38_12]OGH22180.1 MAG: hypothetical protein A3D75_01830 [Candidatus Levybacteria bacterium RIFCSPHIGHO2_02_FULL_37_18]OGH22199.1 MAG: hypothetical protein A3F31_01740 [Candidatus Levybacteria bacterium RIFCSPHIGHO2_12_FULL_38_12]OGH34363.1 MAG: hypothetical protein A3A47_02100 [Candidatus Levybacteria bacterium RIFCSPLOWO2_01_FULL_37_20]OGH44245.1 MAG: hypothetical protein A3J14_01685 [Candidatus Lev